MLRKNLITNLLFVLILIALALLVVQRGPGFLHGQGAAVVQATPISPIAEPTATSAVPTITAEALASPTVEPTAPPSPPTSTPELPLGSGTILFEAAGELYWLPVDERGNALAPAARVPIELAERSKVGIVIPASDGGQVFYEVYSLPPEGCCEPISTLHVLSLSDGHSREVFIPMRLSHFFGWHPDSQHLVYSLDDGTIWLFDVNTGERTLVGETQKWANLPYGPAVDGVAFSPDGKRLVASFTLTGQGYEVWTANADGSEPRQLFLFENARAVFGFAWSPDGNHIAFLGPEGLEIISPDGQSRRAVSQNFSVGWGFELRWSPDSRFIAFTAWEQLPEYESITEVEQEVFQYHKVHIVDVVTGQEWRLVPDDTGGDITPAWSPDGQRIVFLSNRSGTSEVWIASLDGTELRQLTSDGRPKRLAPAWLPGT